MSGRLLTTAVLVMLLTGGLLVVPAHAQINADTIDEIDAELERAADERLRNAERLTRLETLADRQFDLTMAHREDLSSLQDRVRQLSDRISDLLTTLLVGAMAMVGVLLPLLLSLLRGQRSNRTEVLQARQRIEQTNRRVEHVAGIVNGSSDEDTTGEV